MKKRLFSGVQPSGIIHIGNWLGAIKNWVELQEKYDSIFSIVDYHSLTVFQKPDELRKNILNLASLYIAAGINPEKCIIFKQSDVPEHTELTWILSTVTPLGELKRMTQYKEKTRRYKEKINAGLLNYPILMASDILLYNTDVVPVGEDQVQHIEFTRDLAKKFNKRYGETFKIPEALLTKIARVMSLQNPNEKMSKTATSDLSYISLTDSPELIQKKIQKAVTDSGNKITFCEKRAAISNLLRIYQGLTEKSEKETIKKFKGKGYADFKKELAKTIIEKLSPIQKKYNELVKKPAEIYKILDGGAKKAREIANAKMQEVKKKIGVK